jgi:hypothetical protein
LSAASLLDVAYVLRLNEARRHDADMLAAAIARGVEDVAAMAEDLASDGAEASFERALEEVDMPTLPEPDEEMARATVVSLKAWVDQVNAGMQ